eukprot:TRINITY_DN1305_c0_g1_i2.p1 TRINITY_DN1305_c0_g1~~TRINITY_DN1305_c0_g1_i2.p1  ORF type:complete len:260 (+),score=9.27 TRINITY_DN1305_c0_g1_i2:189-968(+)
MKRRQDSPCDDALSSSADSADEAIRLEADEGAPEEVQVDFCFYDPQDGDFHALRHFLTNYLEGEMFNSSELVDHIISQKTVGTTIKIGDGTDIFGFISVINVQRYAGLDCVSQIKDFVLSHCPAHEKDRFLAMWDDKTKPLGIVFNERMVNLPLQLVPHLHTALRDEIVWAWEDEPTQEARDSFKFGRYLYLSYVMPLPGGGSKRARTEASLLYPKYEDELIRDVSRAPGYPAVMNGACCSSKSYRDLCTHQTHLMLSF